MSEDHFIRTFRAAVGVPPGAYLLKRRISAAAEKLHFTDDSIEKIAEQMGFCDRSYFSRAFAKHMGAPPAIYRKRCKGKT